MDAVKSPATRLVLSLLLSVLLFGSFPPDKLCAQHPFTYGATLEHHNGSATIQASGARPLDAVVEAMREEYGWVVDYEDPPYQSQYDVGSIPWPAHPGLRWAVPAGGAFRSTYKETPQMWSSPAAELDLLGKIASDFDQSGNPGNFTVRELSDGSVDVIGIAVRNNSGNLTSVTPILDTRISVPAGTHDGMTTLDLIAHALSEASGVQVDVGAPVNALIQSSITSSGASTSARSLLLETVDSARVKLVWELRFDPQTKSYGLSVLPAMRARYDTFGNRSLVPVAIPRVPGG